MLSFRDLFLKATHYPPFSYQERMAGSESPRMVVNVPTGSGKTAAAFFAWLWRRRFARGEIDDSTPRRLIYCLPMKVLVEQTRNSAKAWLEALGLQSDIGLVVLMGGEDEDDWHLHPELDAVIVGTQDMLLSRALNRGYAASRPRWPIHFGLLNSDCRWVLDEVQLMGPGLRTTAQLEALRAQLGAYGAVSSLWMSATLQRSWLQTADLDLRNAHLVELEDEDRTGRLKEVIDAAKPLTPAKNTFDDGAALAGEILNAHRQGSRTLVVVNTIRKAIDLYGHLNKVKQKLDASLPVLLLHSRFRPPDREEKIDALLAKPGERGAIIVSTQVVEAGVDFSARTLFTELAPWSSLVQRFGRCNRRGEYKNRDAAVFWIDVNDDDDAAALPYELSDLKAARLLLTKCRDAGISHLPHDVEMNLPPTETLRRRDLVGLFDTTPDLAGNDIDIDRFVRAVEESDARIFWRAWDRRESQKPSADQPAPSRKELCAAPIGDFRKFASDPDRRGMVWRWNFLERIWERVDPGRAAPGQTFMIHSDAGGYSRELGWAPESGQPVAPLMRNGASASDVPEANDDDRLSKIGVWQVIADHTDQVCTELERIITEVNMGDFEANALRYGTRWHDRGKAHEIFRAAVPDEARDATKLWAKAAGTWKRYRRPRFRHELASGLSVLLCSDYLIPGEYRDLAAYLAAAHHGRVRLSIRSLPGEMRPDGGRRFARGIWDGDELPETDLGGGVVAPAITLSLEPMELGRCEEPPFAGQPSWAERMIALRDTLGPFRLAYLEAIVRAADQRASAAAERREAEQRNRE